MWKTQGEKEDYINIYGNLKKIIIEWMLIKKARASGTGAWNRRTYLKEKSEIITAQSSGALEYADCTASEGYDLSKGSPKYDIKTSDGDMELSEMLRTPSLPLGPKYGSNRNI